MQLAKAIFFSILLILLSSSTCYAARRVCVNSAGDLVLKRKCNPRRGLSPASLSLLSQSVESPKGDTGPAGKDGIDGSNGRDGISGYEVVTERSVAFQPVSALSGQAICPAGKVVIAGGCDSQISNTYIQKSLPNPTNSGWFCRLTSPSGSVSGILDIHAICAVISP